MKFRFLTELDALLDTRVGLLDQLSPTHAVALLKNVDYFKRNVDRFEPLCGFPDDIFQEAWKRRSVETLKHSLQTGVIDMLHFAVVSTAMRSLEEIEVRGASVEVNTYPYTLTDAETEAFRVTIAKCLGVHRKFAIEVTMIHQPPEYFTPSLIRQRYVSLILYNFIDWFKIHHAALIQHPMPQVSLAIPKLWPEKPLPEDRLILEDGIKVDPWVEGVIPLLQYVAVEYIDVWYFCIVHPGLPTAPLK